MQKSLSSIPYCPSECDDTFEQRLVLQSGFSLSSHKPLSTDEAVIRPRWRVTPTSIEYDDQTFLTFFDDARFRALFRCLFTQAEWKHADLVKRVGLPLTKKQRNQVSAYLAYCKEQAFLEQKGATWRKGSQLSQVSNLGPTFEWAVMEYLRIDHHALVRRCVQLCEMSTPGDLDVVALRDDLSMMVECKSSSGAITKQNIHMFLQRAAEFHSDVALLLIDTASEDPLSTHMKQMNQELSLPVPSAMLRQIQGGSIVYWVADNLYIANTAGGIRTALKATVRLGLALKKLVRFFSRKP